MKKTYFILILFMILLIPEISANFVCGYVNGNTNLSSSWMNAIVYYQENPLDISRCQVNNQRKYCCDLNEIKSVQFSTGKTVYAEIFDTESEVVAGPVNLTTNSDGYMLFENMTLEKAIKINNNYKKININQSALKLNISNNKNYPNVKYKVNQNEEIVCINCVNKTFEIQLNKGKNNIKIIIWNNNREFSENISVYSLDYLNVKHLFKCSGCKNNVLPDNTEAEMIIKINSSHLIQEEIITYIPESWEIPDEKVNEQEYSETHKQIKFIINSSYHEEKLKIKTPNVFFPRNYLFKTNILDFNFDEDIKVFSFFKWFYFPVKFEKGRLKRMFKIGPEYPLILKPFSGDVYIIALYPKQETRIKADLEHKRNWFKGEERFKIISDISKENVKDIFVQVIVEDKKERYIVDSQGTEIELIYQKSDKNKKYFYAYINDFEFKIKKR